MADAAEARKDFFISYHHADRAWAEWIAWHLEQEGHSVLIQAWDFRAGGNFIGAMDDGVANCRTTLAVLSPDYFNSEYTKAEWTAACAQQLGGQADALLPVRVKDFKVKGLLASLAYVNLVGLAEPAAKETLLAAAAHIRGGSSRKKPQVKPPLPDSAAAPVAEKPPFPVGLPPIFSVPHLRNPNFTGRVAILKNLRKALTSGKTAALTQAIHGLGGVGKTQLALEYAYRHADDYKKIIWWVRSENTAQLASDYAALATALGLPEKDDQNQSAIVAAVRQHLEHTDGWLLVFDNVADSADLHDLLPRSGTGHVIVTSRNPHWKGVGSPLPVEIFERDESVKFLLQRTGSKDKKAAGALAEALGDLPLALEQAAAYVESTGIPLSEYLKLFEGHTGKMLAFCKANPDYPCAVATTWLVSMEAAAKECPAATDLLGLCAFLAPDDIPLDVIAAGTDLLPKRLATAAKDPLELNKAVAALKRFSLVKTSAEAKTLSVHRLVQAVVRDRMAAKEAAQWTEAAVKVINKAFPLKSDDVRTWPACAYLLAHGLAAAEHAEKAGLAESATGRVLNQVGLYLRGRAQFKEAKTALERALKIYEAAYGPGYPHVATSVNNLGSVLRAQGDLAGARAAYERALKIDEAAYGPNHTTVALRLNNLGRVLQDQGDLAGARAAIGRALKIDEAAYGPDHPDVATDINNLGSVLRAMGDLQGACAAFKRTLRIYEASCGTDHPNVATVVNNLGRVLQDQGDMAGARAAYERALSIDEATYGPDHPEVATDANNLGGVLHRLGDLASARATYERALKIDEATYGPDHPNVGRDVNNLGSVLQHLGDLAGARAAYERALRISRKWLGDKHSTTALFRKNLESLG